MNDRRHARRDEDAEPGRPPALRRDRQGDPETASILDLQASAGNRAVQALLETRETSPAPAVQRDWGPQKPRDEPRDGSPSATGTMTIPDMKLAMPIFSLSHQAGGAGQAKSQSGVVNVTIAFGSHDAEIVEAVAKGRQFDTITIALGSRQTFTLHSVLISSYTAGNEMTALSLSFTSMEFKFSR